MKAEKAQVVEDQTEGIYVRFVYRPSDDKRRHTAFYECVNIKSANHLVAALLEQDK